MWLMKLHFAVSILCLLGFIGMKIVFSERIKRFSKKGGKKRLRNYLIFFCPVVNIMFFIGICFMSFCNDISVEIINAEDDDEE